jgi:hypothetical protein
MIKSLPKMLLKPQLKGVIVSILSLEFLGWEKFDTSKGKAPSLETRVNKLPELLALITTSQNFEILKIY